MCRFALYMGPPITLDMLITRPEHSIVRQSFKSRMRIEPLNGDGFGIAWYAAALSPDPAVFRSVQPAWNDANLNDLSRVTQSSTILAHVRAATAGLGVSHANCHPFTAGPLAFMHNGAVPEFNSLKRHFQQRLSDEAFSSIRGTTDSEHVFALFQDHYHAERHSRGRSRDGNVEAMADALHRTIGDVVEIVRAAGIEKRITLNLALSDGLCSVATRFVSGDTEGLTLFVSTGRQYVCDGTTCHMVESNEANQAVIVASEPLTEDPAWREVPDNHMVLIHADLSVTYRELR